MMIRSRLASLVLALFLCGCAASESRLLRIGDDLSETSASVLWPAPPEVPRYRYQGQLLGDVNYRPVEEKRTDWAALWRMIAGIGQENPEALTLQRPQTGTVDRQGRILVTDVSRGSVAVFARTGGIEFWEFASALRRFSSPVGIASARNGETFVADADLREVFVLAEDGSPKRSVGKGLLLRPTGVAIDDDRGELFIADTHAHDVKVFDLQGQHLRMLGRRGEARGEFNYPTHLHFDRDRGELYVSDTLNNRVQVFARGQSEPRLVVGSIGNMIGQFARPKGVTTDSEGNIYVVESYYDHLVVFDSEGRLLLPIGGLGKNVGQFYLPSGVWSDANNRIFVSDMFNGRIAVMQFLGGGANGEY